MGEMKTLLLNTHETKLKISLNYFWVETTPAVTNTVFVPRNNFLSTMVEAAETTKV
jgi:hypothetical protein